MSLLLRTPRSGQRVNNLPSRFKPHERSVLLFTLLLLVILASYVALPILGYMFGYWVVMSFPVMYPFWLLLASSVALIISLRLLPKYRWIRPASLGLMAVGV